MGSEPKSLQDFYISSKEPDIGSVIVGMFLVCGFSAPFLFIALFSLFEFFFLEGTSMGVVFGISFLVIPFFFNPIHPTQIFNIATSSQSL